MPLVALLIALQQAPAPEGERPHWFYSPEEIEVVRTKTAYSLPAGELEVDLVASFRRFDEEGFELDVAELVVEVEFGVFDHVMVELEVPYLLLDSGTGPRERGWGDAEIEAKFDWGRSLLRTAVGVEATILTGDEDRGLGAPEPEVGFFVVVSLDVDWMRGHVNYSIESARGRGPEHGFRAAAEFAFEEGVKHGAFVAAVNGEFEAGEAPAWSLLPGFEYWFSEEFKAGAALEFGLTEEAPAWGVLVHLELEF
jgi:hypothetical protein